MDKPGFEYLIGREKWCKIFTLDQYHDHACDHSTTIMLSTFCHSNSCNDNVVLQKIPPALSKKIHSQRQLSLMLLTPTRLH